MAVAVNPYDIQRNRIRQDSAIAATSQNDALKRRFASMGNLNSGSYLKAQELLSGQQEQDAQRATEGVDVQEAQSAEQKAEAEKQRQFATNERLGSQDFSASQNALGRAFTTSERLGSENFADVQGGKQRDWSTSERLGAQAFTTGERLGAQDFSHSERVGAQQFATSERLGAQDFSHSERLGSQDFSNTQGSLQRAWQSGENQLSRKSTADLQTQSQGWQSGENALSRALQSSQFETQQDLANRQFEEEKNVNEANRQAQLKAGNKSSLEGFKAASAAGDYYTAVYSGGAAKRTGSGIGFNQSLVGKGKYW